MLYIFKVTNSSTTVAGSSKGLTRYPMLYIQIWAPGDGRRNQPETCRAFHRNK